MVDVLDQELNLLRACITKVIRSREESDKLYFLLIFVFIHFDNRNGSSPGWQDFTVPPLTRVQDAHPSIEFGKGLASPLF